MKALSILILLTYLNNTFASYSYFNCDENSSTIKRLLENKVENSLESTIMIDLKRKNIDILEGSVRFNIQYVQDFTYHHKATLTGQVLTKSGKLINIAPYDDISNTSLSIDYSTELKINNDLNKTSVCLIRYESDSVFKYTYLNGMEIGLGYSYLNSLFGVNYELPL